MADRLARVVSGRRVRLVEGGDGVDPITLALMLRQAADREGIGPAALARRCGRSAPWVSSILGLLRLDPAVQAMVRDGRLTVSHAKPLIRLPQPAQVALARRAVKHGLSAHSVEEAAAALKREGGRRP